MSLTKGDLQLIRDVFDKDGRLIVREEVASVVNRELVPIRLRLDGQSNRLEAVYNDIKDLYHMISDLNKTEEKLSSFGKSNLEQKLVTAYREIQAIAKAEGVTLPE